MTRKKLLAALLAILGIAAVVALVVGGTRAAATGDHCPDGSYQRGGHDCEPEPCPTTTVSSRGGHHEPCEPTEPTPTEPTPTEPTPTEPTPTEPTPTEPTEPPTTEPPPTEPPSTPPAIHPPPKPPDTSECIGDALFTTTYVWQNNSEGGTWSPQHSTINGAAECDRGPDAPPLQEEGM